MSEPFIAGLTPAENRAHCLHVEELYAERGRIPKGHVLHYRDKNVEDMTRDELLCAVYRLIRVQKEQDDARMRAQDADMRRVFNDAERMLGLATGA
jgi:hypothetical protein